jgi:signal transduction histidine kinase
MVEQHLDRHPLVERLVDGRPLVWHALVGRGLVGRWLGRMSRRAAPIWLFAAALAGGTAALYFTVLHGSESGLVSSIAVPWWALVPAFVAFEAFAVHLHFRREVHTFTLMELPLIIGLFFVEPGPLILARVVGGIIALGFMPSVRQPLTKLVFNVALYALESAIVVFVFRSIVAIDPAGELAPVVAALAAALGGTALAAAGMLLAVRLASGEAGLRDAGRSLALALAVTLVNAGVAVAIALLVERSPYVALLLVPAAVMLVFGYRALLSAKTRQQGHEFLQETVRRIHAAADVDEAVEAVLVRVRALYDADVCELVIISEENPGTTFVASVSADGEPVGLHPERADAPGVRAAVAVAERDSGVLLRASSNGLPLPVLNGAAVREAMIAPLDGEVLPHGAIIVANIRGDVPSFDASTLAMLQSIATAAGGALEGMRLGKQLDRLTGLLRERDELEAQLRQAQKMEAVGRLAGGIAHDFNNLMTIVLGSSHLAAEAMEADDPARRAIDDIRAAGERATSLTKQLLAFSRKQVMRAEVIDLNAFVAGTDSVLQRLIGANIEIRCVHAQQLGLIKADPGQLEQVLMNLIVNARDAMKQGGSITIETANVDIVDGAPIEGTPPAGRYVRLRVEDTGSGMDDQTLAHLFEPFFTTKEVGQGSGLGLSTVYGIVKQSGGFVFARSAPGEGSSFEVFLPRVNDRGRPVPIAGIDADSIGATVLVVEDEEMVRAVAIATLERAGMRVLSAATGEEALLVAAADGPVDLLLTDVVMPGMSGPELAAALEATSPLTKVVFISGYSWESLGHRYLVDPEVPYIQKPFVPSMLVSRVRAMISDPTEGIALGDLAGRAA